MIQVAAAIIEKNGKLLICRRGPGGSCAYLWEFPGGKLEPGETPAACAVRECREELGIAIRLKGLYETTSYRYPEREVALTFFRAEIADGTPARNVHSAIKWVLPGELTAYEFCPADVEMIKKLSKTENGTR